MGKYSLVKVLRSEQYDVVPTNILQYMMKNKFAIICSNDSFELLQSMLKHLEENIPSVKLVACSVTNNLSIELEEDLNLPCKEIEENMPFAELIPCSTTYNSSNEIGKDCNLPRKESLQDRLNKHDVAVNKKEVEITAISTSVEGGKKYFCIFCKQLFSKLVKHMECSHADEPQVREFNILPKGNPERKQLIEIIRKKGCYEYNTNEKYNNGNLILVRRPSKQKSVDDFTVCPYCTGFYARTSIKHHYKSCLPSNHRAGKEMRFYSRQLLGRVHEKACPVLRNKVIPGMREDPVTKIARYDLAIILFANKLCQKYRSPHHYNMIRARIRYLGRLLIEIRKLDTNVKDLKSALIPKYYDIILTATNIVAGLNTEGDKYNAPSTAFNMGTLIKKCSRILVTESIKNENEEQKKQFLDLIQILEEDFPSAVNKTVSENQSENKRQKKIILPSNEDISKLNNYLNKNCREAFNNMKRSFTKNQWRKLCDHTLISIQLFNRRRAGEMERIKVSDFYTYQTFSEVADKDMLNKLNETMLNRVNKYGRIVIRGKFARGVSVLISSEHYTYLQIILKYRAEADVNENNPYLFAVPKSDEGHLCATALMRRFSGECGASMPSALRGTQLRKHVATQSVLLNLQENEVSDLANFMGHAEKIHREHYRLPIISREILHISRLLEKVQETDIADSLSVVSEATIDISDTAKLTGDKSTSDLKLCRDISKEVTDSNENFDFNSPSASTSNNLGNVHVSANSSHRDPYSTDNASDFEPYNTDSSDEVSNKSKKYNRRTNKRSVSPYGRVARVSWTTPEKKIARTVFSTYMRNSNLPSLEVCARVINEHQELKNRSAACLKAWINNQLQLQMNTDHNTIKRVRTWHTPERHAVRQIFQDFIDSQKLPSQIECKNRIRNVPALQNRSVAQVKAFINNYINRNKKKEDIRRKLF